MKIAAWSGPRNISTAMMYAFSNRSDCTGVDEPFYAAYLNATGLEHPMRDAILASQPQDPAQVIANLKAPDASPHVYHKHMAQHMIPQVPRDWFDGFRHLILIRHPARVVASFSAKFDDPTLADIGFTQQAELFQQLTDEGHEPLVVDSVDLRRNPEAMLRRICEAFCLSWDSAMLQWEPGPKPVDGVWGSHWYDSAHRSTGFAGPEGNLPVLAGRQADLVAQALPYYERLFDHRLVT